MTLDELRADPESYSGETVAYREKQLHVIPDLPVVNRQEFILTRVKGKVVLDIGASGPMHEAIVGVSAKCYGIDRPNPTEVRILQEKDMGVTGIDLDKETGWVPKFGGVELIVCGEVIEHLGNPQSFLQRLRAVYKDVPVIITVPNAFSTGGVNSLNRGIENVNSDHVAYYSYTTLTRLVTRVGYKVCEAYWYNGQPKFAEGLIFVVR